MFWADNHVHQNIFLESTIRYVTFNRVCTGPEKPGKSLNFIDAYPGLESPGKRLFVLESSKNLINSSTEYEIYDRQ